MKIILNFLWERKKWGLVLAYLLLSSILFHKRETLYCYIALFRATPLGDLPLDLFFGALLLLGLVCCIDLIRRPWYISRRVTRTLQRWHITNALGEYPTLRYVHMNPHKDHELIIDLNGKGLSLVDMDRHLEHLQAGLNGKVRMEYGDRSNVIRLYLLPRRYVKPTSISLDTIQLCQEPNILVVGKTGSGKSYALAVILGTYVRFIPDVTLVICDYKMSSFAQFSDTRNFYGYEDVPKGIRAVYQEFTERLAANDEERNSHIWVLLIDEYGALISAADRSERETLKTMVGNMLFMGRSLGIRVLIGVQRSDAEYFKAGARDQFRAILAMGNISKEQKQMLFAEYKDGMDERNGVGEGYLLIDGQDIERVKVEPIRDMDRLNASIREAMEHDGRRSVSESRPGAAC